MELYVGNLSTRSNKTSYDVLLLFQSKEDSI